LVGPPKRILGPLGSWLAPDHEGLQLSIAVGLDLLQGGDEDPERRMVDSQLNLEGPMSCLGVVVGPIPMVEGAMVHAP
jgi:hypothetical protein